MGSMNNRDQSSGLGAAYRAASPYLSLGIQFVAIILVCLFAGKWADERFATSPLFILIGAGFGIAAGFYHFFKAVLGWGNKSEDEH